MEERVKKKRAKTVFTLILLVLANVIVFGYIWLVDKYDQVQLDQILYQLKSSTKGTNPGFVLQSFLLIFGEVVIATLIEIGIYLILSGKAKKLLEKSAFYIKYSASKVCAFFKKRALSLTAIQLIFAMIIFIVGLDVGAFVITSTTESDFIEENYVDPESVDIKIPEQKRNLIYIFLESMETTFSDTEAGGSITEDFIPELSELAAENVSFSNTDGIGGASSYFGTTWTAAALFAQTSGMIIKVPLFADDYDTEFLPGITTLGDILEKEGYNQTLLFGSDAEFACRDTYFTNHGGYKIVDTVSLKADGRLPESYNEWWGFEDEKLFEYAKEELSELAVLGEPFNFTMLTADTHFPQGYKCPLCEDRFELPYANVLSCSSKQVYNFINWVKEQPFYENTTIILAGDHLTMDPEFLEEIDEDYERTVYNCIINGVPTPEKMTGRSFGTFDLFPTTLAAMGVKIEGERLGLGTNLYSGEKTLGEIYGFEFMNGELQKKSEFYNTRFYMKKDKYSLV